MTFRKAAIAFFAAAATTAFAAQVDSETLRQAQQALSDKGFDIGAADGKWGPHTQAAVQKFQAQQQLTPSGQLDAPTLAALNVQASSGFGPRPNAVPEPSATSGNNAIQSSGTNASQPSASASARSSTSQGGK